ncbi:MAG: hypothetical protein PF489_12940 [Salinivirgaceae bacterium]|jgi:hypothetical protein|nr:hypothetical protein [Salinivirgaceae bacterium]
MKRLIIATLLGVASGFICYAFASSGQEVAFWMAVSIIFSRTLIGFAIGISRLKMGHWALHGTIMGLIFSLPGSFAVMAGPANPDFCPATMFFMTLIMGMLYGLIIELITSIVFKAKQ